MPTLERDPYHSNASRHATNPSLSGTGGKRGQDVFRGHSGPELFYAKNTFHDFNYASPFSNCAFAAPSATHGHARHSMIGNPHGQTNALPMISSQGYIDGSSASPYGDSSRSSCLWGTSSHTPAEILHSHPCERVDNSFGMTLPPYSQHHYHPSDGMPYHSHSSEGAIQEPMKSVNHASSQGVAPAWSTRNIFTSSSELVYDLRDEDVLCGRGAPTNYHPGNLVFRQLVSKYQSSYLACRRSDKPEIAMKLVKIIHDRGGRFLKRTKIPGMGPAGHFCWKEIGEQRAYEKTCQALRENAPEIRRLMAAQELAKAVSSDSQSQASPQQSDHAMDPTKHG